MTSSRLAAASSNRPDSESVTSRAAAVRTRYHHGDLRRALIEAAARLIDGGEPGQPTLKAVAAKTGGEYYHAGTAADLRKVYESLSLKFALERRETEISALFSGAAALLAICAVLLSMAWFRRRA